MGCALRADVTVTFGWEKLGSVLYPGRLYAGQVITADIGFPEEAVRRAPGAQEGIRAFCLEPEDKKEAPERPPYSNKGTFWQSADCGRVEKYGRRCFLKRSGSLPDRAGLVKIFTDQSNRSFINTRLPVAILETYDPEDFEKDYEGMRSRIESCCSWADAVVWTRAWSGTLGQRTGGNGIDNGLHTDYRRCRCPELNCGESGACRLFYREHRYYTASW